MSLHKAQLKRPCVGELRLQLQLQQAAACKHGIVSLIVFVRTADKFLCGFQLLLTSSLVLICCFKIRDF